MKANQLDTKALQKELDSLINPPTDTEGHSIKRTHSEICQVEVRLDYNMNGKAGVDEWERKGKIGMTFRLNPRNIKTGRQLEQKIQWFREQATV